MIYLIIVTGYIKWVMQAKFKMTQHTEGPGWVSDSWLRQCTGASFRLFVCVKDDLKHQERYSTNMYYIFFYFADPLVQSKRIKLSKLRIKPCWRTFSGSTEMWTFWSVGQSLYHWATTIIFSKRPRRDIWKPHHSKARSSRWTQGGAMGLSRED